MTKRKLGINSFTLHIIAMALMLCDHMWATVIRGNAWMTALGRLAYPIFAFMIVEGYFHTKNIKRYLLRLLIGALISEIPFNLMYNGGIVYPFHQNVMWTFLIALLCILLTEKAMKKGPVVGYLSGIGIFLVGFLLGFLTMADYFGFGILTVAVFYFFHGDAWWKKLLQIAGLYYVNAILMGGQYFEVTLAGHTFEIMQQGLAVFAMIPILLYNQEQGPHNKWIQYSFYLFYPAHMLILALIALNL